MYARQHAGAAIQNFLLKITDLKLGCCWVGAYTDEYVKEELRIPDHIEVEALLPIGHPYLGTASKQKKPKKISLEQCIFWDYWDLDKKPPILKNPRTW